MNTYSLGYLKEILNIKEVINVSHEIVFDYLRITPIKKYEKEALKTLYFPIILDESWVNEGWIKKPIDLQSSINEVITMHPDYTYLIEEHMLSQIKSRNAKLIIVDSIMNSIEILYKTIINSKKYEVVAITGSAGKTTTVGIIEAVLKEKYKVLRIYSSRITPILLKSYIINLLNKSFDVIVLEMALYYKDHVAFLSELLHPTVSAIINIGKAHIGTGGLENINDICVSKSYIFRNSQVGFINGDDAILKELHKVDDGLYYKGRLLFYTNLKELKTINPNTAQLTDEGLIIKGNNVIVPILTELSLVQYLLAYSIGEHYNVKEELIIKALNNFTTVENRLQRVNLFGRSIIFDGDSSFNERIHQLSLHLYKKAYLVIRNYGADYYIDDFTGIKDYFDKFERVFLFGSIRYIDKLKDFYNVVVVSNHDFINNLEGEIFYHYHDYNYKYDKLEEKNLV